MALRNGFSRREGASRCCMCGIRVGEAGKVKLKYRVCDDTDWCGLCMRLFGDKEPTPENRAEARRKRQVRKGRGHPSWSLNNRTSHRNYGMTMRAGRSGSVKSKELTYEELVERGVPSGRAREIIANRKNS